MSHDVFISHSVADQTLADSLCKYLEKQGIFCWLAPRDVPQTESNWSGEPRTLQYAIQNCQVFLLLLSRSACESERINNEASLAHRLHRRFCVISIETDLPSPETLPYYHSDLHLKDVSHLGDYEKLREISSMVASILNSIADDEKLTKEVIAKVQSPVDKKQHQSLIFVSYKRDDLYRIEPIIQHLDREQYNFWIDKKIPGGVEWDAHIEGQIKKSALIMLFLSNIAVKSKYVRREVKFADRLDKPLLSVLLEPVELIQGMDMLLTQFQMIDATQKDFFEILQRSLDNIIKSGKYK